MGLAGGHLPSVFGALPWASELTVTYWGRRWS